MLHKKHEAFRELCLLNGTKIREWIPLDRTARMEGGEVFSVYKVSASKGESEDFLSLFTYVFLRDLKAEIEGAVATLDKGESYGCTGK